MQPVQASLRPAPRPRMLQCFCKAPTASLRRTAPAYKASRAGKQLICRPQQPCTVALRNQQPASAGVGTAAAAGGQGTEGDAAAEANQQVPDTEALLKELQGRLKAAGLPLLDEDELAAEDEEEGSDDEDGIDDWLAELGMGMWRLRDLVCPQIEVLVAQIENSWREALPDLGLYPLPMEFKYMDSLDPEGKVPFSYQTLSDPQRGAEGWPRLQVENRCYESRAFRKLHLEVAVRQDGLQVLHCVMYPRLEFDLPILSMDLVANEGRVSLAIIDPCPVSGNLTLPRHYLQSVRELQARFPLLASNRRVPDWGKAIFSSECVIMRPSEGAEIAEFLKYAIALSDFHVQLGRLANPVQTQRATRLRELHAAHQRYRDKQLENDKTRAVLAKAFGGDKAEAYMEQVMFDCEELPTADSAAS